MSEMNERQRNEKIIKMKMQTAKVLWGENRKEAAFLVLESIDDPRADELRDRMGFDDDFEVTGVQRQSVPLAVIGIGAVILIVVSFLLGTVLDLGGAGDTPANQVLTEDEIINTIVAPTPEPGEPITQPMVDMTGTADQIQVTQQSVATEQNRVENLLMATRTALYQNETATAEARSTEAAGG